MATERVIAVLGGQWGDEGKGKLVDLLAMDADLVCRAQVSGMGVGAAQAPHLTAARASFISAGREQRRSHCGGRFRLVFLSLVAKVGCLGGCS